MSLKIMPFTDACYSLNLWQLWNILQMIPPSVVKGDIDRDSGSVFYNYLPGSCSWEVQANRPRQRRALHQEIHMPFVSSVEVGWGVHSLMMNIYSKASVAKVLAKNPVQLRCLLEHKKVLSFRFQDSVDEPGEAWVNSCLQNPSCHMFVSKAQGY